MHPFHAALVSFAERREIDMKKAIRDIMLQRLEDEQNSTKYFYRCDLYSDGIFYGETTDRK